MLKTLTHMPAEAQAWPMAQHVEPHVVQAGGQGGDGIWARAVGRAARAARAARAVATAASGGADRRALRCALRCAAVMVVVKGVMMEGALEDAEDDGACLGHPRGVRLGVGERKV